MHNTTAMYLKRLLYLATSEKSKRGYDAIKISDINTFQFKRKQNF